MNLFIKVLDGIDPEKSSLYTAWYIQQVMNKNPKEKLISMWLNISQNFC